MKEFYNYFRFELLLSIIGILTISIWYFLFDITNQTLIYPDTESYLSAADSIYFHARGHNLRPMILAVIHGFPFLFTHDKLEVIQWNIFTNLICFIFSTLLIYNILNKYISNNKAFFISLIPYLFIGYIANIFHMLSEGIFTFTTLLAFYFLNQYQLKRKYKFLIFFLSILTVSMLIRPGNKLFALIFILYFIQTIILNLKNKWNYLLIFSWFLVFVQMAGIKYQFGNFTISYVDSVTYYNYLGTKAVNFKEGKPFSQLNNPRGEYLFHLDYSDQIKAANEDFKNQLINNTFYLFSAYCDNIYTNTIVESLTFNDWNLSRTRKNVLIAISKFQNIFFTIIGLFLAIYVFLFNISKRYILKAISLFIIYIIFTAGVSSDQGDRFHIVFYSSVLILFTLIFSKKNSIEIKE